MIPDYISALKEYVANLFEYDIHPNQITFKHDLGQDWFDRELGLDTNYFSFEVFLESWDSHQYIEGENLNIENIYLSIPERYVGFFFEQSGTGFNIEVKIEERENNPVVKCSYCGSPWPDEPVWVPDLPPMHIKTYRARENTIDVFYCIECKKYFVKEYRGEWYHDR
jgi:hypothetical protein